MGSLSPAWITNTDCSNMKISPPFSVSGNTFNVEIETTDGFYTGSLTFLIVIINDPPFLASSLTDQTINIGIL